MKKLAMKNSPQARALDWQINPPRELTCSVCGANGPVLSVGDTDAMHTRFAARCNKHIEARPRLRKHYGIVANVEMNSAQLDDFRWFQSNPERTTRLRRTQASESTKEEGKQILVRKYPNGRCVRIVAIGQFSDTMADKELSEIHDRLLNQYYRKKIGGAA